MEFVTLKSDHITGFALYANGIKQLKIIKLIRKAKMAQKEE